jgi:GalNAc-alpha-(1->4)-GalNAc-alpha-(1->3)-diNAcBac-PP-undecaprenol alpha-1,4-N-acetyl-D-galactosaminyltransferase
MKNILFVDTGFEYGGGTKSFLYLLEGLTHSQAKYKISVFFEHNYQISDGIRINNYLKQFNINIIQNNFSKEKIPKWKKELYRLISKEYLYKKEFNSKLTFARKILMLEKFDLIHLNNHFGTNLEYIFEANKLKLPIIQHLRKNSFLNKFQIDTLKSLKFNTISVSKSTYEFYNLQIPIDENIIYNPFPFEKDIQHSNSKEIKILMPANYLENKGHKLVFEALSKVNRDDIKLYLAGTGKFNSETEIEKNELIKKNRVVELGFIENLREHYLNSDFVISFSENEGLPRVVIEGILYGCSVITSNYKVSYEIQSLLENKSKYTIIKRDAKILLDLFTQLKKVYDYRVDCNIQSNFSLDSYIKKIENLYKEIL